MSVDIERIVERVVHEVLSRILTPEEIRRLKQYASDEYYNLYILAKSEIEKTIQRARDALNLANNAYSLADRANNLANTAYSTARGALSQAQDAMSKAEEALSTANTAYSKAYDAFDLADRAMSWADDALKKAKDALSQVDTIWGRIRDIQGFIDDIVNRFSTMKQKLEEAYNKYSKKMEEHRRNIESYASKLVSDARELRKLIDELFNTIGYAELHLERLDCGSLYAQKHTEYRPWDSFARRFAALGWYIGQIYYCARNMVRKQWVGFDIGGTKVGFDIVVPNPSAVTGIAKAAWNAATILGELLENTSKIQDKMNKVLGKIQDIAYDINAIMYYSQQAVDTIQEFIVEIANTIATLVGATEKAKPKTGTTTGFATHRARILRSKHTTTRFTTLTPKLIRKLLLKIDYDKGVVLEAREENLATGKKTIKKTRIGAQITPY